MGINSIDDFLKHKTSSGSGEFLKDWKKNSPPKIEVWLHRKRLPIALWQHQLPKLMVRTNKDTQESKTEIWGGQYNCWETEDVLTTQYFRNDDGSRKKYPKRCPLCRLIEVVGEMIEEEQLDWLAPIFRFEGDEDTRVLHAGGIAGLFKGDLNDSDKEALRKAGIKLNVPKGSKEQAAWQENAHAKCSYVFCVVDNGNPEKGVQITTVTSLLGDKVKEVMNDAIEEASKNPRAVPGEGNPFLQPYAIQWEHRPGEQEFGKKYKARRMGGIPLTPEIDSFISGAAPDLSHVIAPFNIETMRAYLERHATVKLPWDYIFDIEVPKEEQTKAAGEFPPAEKDAAHGNPGSRHGGRAQKAPAPLPSAPASASDAGGDHADPNACPECHKTEEQGCPHVACDECDGAILETDAKCKHCGKVYREEAPLPPPAGRRKRSGASPVETGDKPKFAR